MAAQVSQGSTAGYEVESALGVNTGTFSDFRWGADSMTGPSQTRTGIANPNIGHRNANDQSDKPIFIEAHQPDSLPFTTYIRRSASANTNPPLAEWLGSAGWQVSKTTVSSVASYVSTTQFDLADTGDAYGLPGNAILTKIDDATSDLDNFYYLSLIAAKSTDTVTLGMALPAATSNAEPIEVVSTMTPYSRVVPATSTLSFIRNLRATHTSGEDLAMEYEGCALSSLGEMTLEPNMAPELSWTFHVSRVNQDSVAIADEVFVDSEKFGIVTHDMRVEYGTSVDAGGIARGDVTFISAVINWGPSCTPRPGFGGGTLAGIQGYKQDSAPPSITLTADFSKSYWDDMEGTNPSRYIGLVQPTSDLATPAFGIWMPKCHLDSESTVVLNTTDNLITATVKYIGSVADYNSETDNDDLGAAPIYFAVSGASS